jgi:hypothetical protein
VSAPPPPSTQSTELPLPPRAYLVSAWIVPGAAPPVGALLEGLARDGARRDPWLDAGAVAFLRLSAGRDLAAEQRALDERLRTLFRDPPGGLDDGVCEALARIAASPGYLPMNPLATAFVVHLRMELGENPRARKPRERAVATAGGGGS